MVYEGPKITNDALLDIAQKMLLAARTAPKGRGIDMLEYIIINGKEINTLSKKMLEIAGDLEAGVYFRRDAENILNAGAIVLLGTKTGSMDLGICGMCGYPDCKSREGGSGGWCAFNTGDLGIALGSAVSIAADHRIDNRIMYTAGLASLHLGLFSKEVLIAYAIPLSATGKNPFFDRK